MHVQVSIDYQGITIQPIGCDHLTGVRDAHQLAVHAQVLVDVPSVDGVVQVVDRRCDLQPLREGHVLFVLALVKPQPHRNQQIILAKEFHCQFFPSRFLGVVGGEDDVLSHQHQVAKNAVHGRLLLNDAVHEHLHMPAIWEQVHQVGHHREVAIQQKGVLCWKCVQDGT